MAEKLILCVVIPQNGQQIFTVIFRYFEENVLFFLLAAIVQEPASYRTDPFLQLCNKVKWLQKIVLKKI